MPHVAVIGLRGMPGVMGGIESHCEELLPRLLAHAPAGQLRITVLARRGYVLGRTRHHGVNQIALWSPRHAALETIVHTIWALLYARFVLRAEAVHLHAIGPGLAAPLARLLGFRLLFTHHGEDYRRQKWGRVSKWALRLGEHLAVTFAHRVITVSKTSADRLRARYPKRSGRIVNIPNGLAPAAPKDERQGFPGDLGVSPGQYLITVGRLVPEKAQDLLIDAYRRTDLAQRDPPCKLLIVGASDHDSAYARKIEASTGEGIVFAGQRPRGVVMSLNRDAALFVLPSYHEGLSIAALEALQAGAPILLSDIPGNRDLGLPDHHYFAAGNAQDLAQKLMADVSSYAMPAGFDLAAFDWDQIARRSLRELAEAGGWGDILVPDRTPPGRDR